MAINGKGGFENWIPAPSENPKPMVTKISMGDEVGDNYHCAKFHHDPMKDFSPLSHVRMAYKVTRIVFLGSGDVKPSALIFTINTSNDVVSRRYAFWDSENKILHFDP